MADIQELEPDLQHIHWSFPEHVATLPNKSLSSADEAMDYFALSPFFDIRSNNGVLRTQRRIEVQDYGHAHEKIELRAFRSGFEYIVAHAQPPALFLIHRRDLAGDGSGGRGKPSAMYFVLHDKVYPTPSLYGVMSARLRNASSLVASTFATLSAARPASNPRAPNAWRALPPGSSRSGGTTAQTLGIEPDEVQAPVSPTGDVDMDAATPSQTEAGPSRRRGTAVAPAAASEEQSSAGGATHVARSGPRTAEDKEKENENEAVPDWHLFNALQVTSAAMAGMHSRGARQLQGQGMGSGPAAPFTAASGGASTHAHASGSGEDARAELRRLEAELMAGLSAGAGGSGRGGAQPGSLAQGNGPVALGAGAGAGYRGGYHPRVGAVGGASSAGSPSVRMVSSPVVSLR